MRKKRLKSILAMILTASMILGSGVNVAGEEIKPALAAQSGQSVSAEDPQASVETGQEEKTGEEKTEETVSQEKPSEEKNTEEPAAASENETVRETVSEEGAVSQNDSTSSDNVPAAEAEAGNEEAAGNTTVSPNLYVSGNTVSYNGKKQKITISMNPAGNTYFARYRIITASDDNIKTPDGYKDAFGTDDPIAITGVGTSANEFEVNAVDAAKYAVSVDMVSRNQAGDTVGVVSNNIVFLSINQAAAVKVSVDSVQKYYDGSVLTVSSGDLKAVEGELYRDDLSRIKVAGSRKDAGKSRIVVSADEVSKNYAGFTVSAGEVTVLSIDLVITSKDYFKHHDGKAVEDNARKGYTLTCSQKDVNIGTLSGNLKWNNDSFNWDPSSLISGDQVSTSENKFKLKDEALAGISGNFASITYKFGTITIKKHNWVSNNLKAPKITSVKMNNKGWITIKFKGSKAYKNSAESDKRKNKARYMIYRYDDEIKDWICLNGNNTTNEKKKAEEIELGQTGKSFVDKQAGRIDKSTYIYKVDVIGYDETGKYGFAKNTADNYKACQAIPLEVATRQKDGKSIDFEFSKIRGADFYYIEKSSVNKKNSFSPLVTVSAIEPYVHDRAYSGSKLVSAKSYNDKGKVVTGEKLPGEAVYYTDSPVAENAYLYYKVQTIAHVIDFDESGKMLPAIEVKSDMSTVLKGRNAVCPPDILSAGSARYDQTSIVFEKLSSDDIKIGDSKEYNKYKYQIMRSTKIDGGYKVVKTITGRQLGGDNEGFKEVSKNSLISVNGLNYTAEKDCYVITFAKLKPETTYYYKVRAVRNNVTGAMSNYAAVKPVLNDVISINATNKNYNQITVSTDHVEGAAYMVVTYRAIKDHNGNYLSENSCKDAKFVSKTLKVKKDQKTKKPIYEFVVGGLKHGYTYTFYAEPKNGKKHVTPENKRVYDTEKTRPGKPNVKAEPKNLTEIYVKWETVPGASQYVLEIYDAEDTSKDRKPVKTQTFKKAGKHTWKGGTNGVIDGKSKQSDLDIAGKPYTFVVTAMRKDSYFSGGNWGDPSDGVTEAGRPAKVKNLKAVVNSVNADAKLTWSACKDNTKTTPISYVIEREVHQYKVGTANSFSSNGISSNVFDYKSNYKKLTYSSTTQVIGKAFNNGDKVIYKVIPVYNSGIKGRGQNKDGYVLGVPAKVTYITPYSITIGARNEVTVGGSMTVPISFRPTSTTVKAVNWGAMGNSDYFTQNGAKITGKKSTGDWNKNIFVQAISKANGIASNAGLVKVNAKAQSTSLKVCIDAGHGGEDSGATCNGMQEKNCNLDMALAMRSRLESYGVPVVMTRSDDTYLTVGARPEVAYNNGCNLFISIHCNSGGGKGTEVYKSITQYHDDDLASRIMGKITSTLGTTARGVKTRTGSNGDYYGVIRGSASRGINGMIVEVAFMDGDYDKLSNSSNRQAAGAAIADAVLEKYGYK